MNARFPGATSREMLAEFGNYVIVEPNPFVIDLERSQGLWLATVDGDKIFDWSGYYASKLLCHNHPRMRETEYTKQLLIAANNKVANPDYLTKECVDYYRTLYSLAPVCMRNQELEIYVINSGAEAVENMMKYFVNLHRAKSFGKTPGPVASHFLHFDQSFHGRTVFALNITNISHDPVITRDFRHLISGGIQVPFPAINNDAEAALNRGATEHSLAIVEEMLQKHGEKLAGIIVEPLQGAGGHRIAEKEFFQGLSRLANTYNVALGFDEVQTAGGQLGTIFAVDQLDLPYPPNAVATAKKFGNGVVYMYRHMQDEGVLDSTWGGSLTDMVRFMQEMKIVKEEQLVEKVPALTLHLVSELKKIQQKFPHLISNVRGIGLYQGFSLCSPECKTKLISTALQQHGLFLLGAGPTSIRLRPPLGVSHDDIDLLAQLLGATIAVV